MLYDYREAMREDVAAALDEMSEELAAIEDEDERREYAYDTLWTDDSVTGNGSGSYYCNTYKAESALCHNLDLLDEALAEFGYEGDALSKLLKQGAEAADVTIRCYLLSEILAEVLEERAALAS